MTDPTHKARIVERLTQEDSAARKAIVRIGIDHLLALRVDALVDVDAIVRITSEALTHANATLVLETHVRPGWERHRARVTASRELLGESLPNGTKDRVLAIAEATKSPEAGWAKGLVPAPKVKELVAPVLQATLLSFAKRISFGATSSRAGALGGALLGGIAGQAGKLVDVGKSVMGGIGAEMEKKLQSAARDFADDAMEELRTAMRERLASDEGRRLVREIAAHAVDHLAKVPVATLMADADALPRDRIEALVVDVLVHNVGRKAFGDAVRDEVRAFLAVDGSSTVGDLADRTGLRGTVVALLEERGNALARDFFGAPAFATWLDDLLA